MDFMNRNAQQQPSRNDAPATPSAPAPIHKPDNKSPKDRNGSKLWRIASVCLLFALTILVVGTIGVLVIGGNNQGQFIKKDNYQAVFLTNGQVYFGHLNDIGKDYYKLNDIFYLTQNTQTSKGGNVTSSGNYTLVKLGCQQIHDPFDQMVINRSQVTFWENLQNSGKVVKSIQSFNKQNPNGPNCSNVSSQTQASSSSNTGTQGQKNSVTNTTPAASNGSNPSDNSNKSGQ